MYRGKYLKPRTAPRWMRSKRTGAVLLSLLLLLTFSAGGSLAYLVTDSKPVENRFVPALVTGEITETFDGAKKSNVNIKNTGNVDAYVRIRLISYRVDENGSVIGGTASVPALTDMGQGWARKDGYYYYTRKVAPGETPAVPLIGENGIELQSYTTLFDETGEILGENKTVDLAGGRQVIEVIGEAIQAEGVRKVGGKDSRPVTEAWGIAILEDGALEVTSADKEADA